MRKILCLMAALLLVPVSSYAIHDYPADPYWLASDESSTETIDHSAWQAVLDDYVSVSEDGINRVDYAALQQAPQQLNDYLRYLSKLEIRQFSRAEQLAYWVNLYNALTLQLVADHYPVSSIRRIHGGLFGTGPWDEEVFTVSGKTLTLNDIEHRILRPVWQDYRIHFVVNCASIGCPNLSKVALTGKNADELMTTAAADFLTHPRGLQINGEKARLSKIFKWYKKDFGDDLQELLNTLVTHLPNSETAANAANVKRANYQYDWDLNGLKKLGK